MIPALAQIVTASVFAIKSDRETGGPDPNAFGGLIDTIDMIELSRSHFYRGSIAPCGLHGGLNTLGAIMGS
jgi:hypothetical protein